jgi:hypothetical protein
VLVGSCEYSLVDRNSWSRPADHEAFRSAQRDALDVPDRDLINDIAPSAAQSLKARYDLVDEGAEVGGKMTAGVPLEQSPLALL